MTPEPTAKPSDLPSPAEAGFAKAGRPHVQRAGRDKTTRHPKGGVEHENSKFKAIVFCVTDRPS
jgi:hypothetical protein